MNTRFRAIVATEQDGRTNGELRELFLADLPDEDVLVAVTHSTLNYKDALAVTGTGKICRHFPMVCGIDLAGTVVESRSPSFKPGDRVLVNGSGLSERHWGGYAQYARMNPAWLVPIPGAFSAEEVMGIGTAGYTAMLCVQALQDRGVKPDDGTIIVTGATGGVGSVAIALLATLGYDIAASSGRAEAHQGFLRDLGARSVIDRSEFARKSRPLESERWAAGIDCVGGEVLATLLAQVRYGGTVAACGLAGGVALPSTVMPFILRGVTLAGVDSVMAPRERRLNAWKRLAELLDPNLLRKIYTVHPMSQVPQLATDLLAGRSRGRIVIDVDT
jgi:acrylyl-CoA reductase (NADPH)